MGEEIVSQRLSQKVGDFIADDRHHGRPVRVPCNRQIQHYPRHREV